MNAIRGYSKGSFTKSSIMLTATDLRTYLRCPRTVFLRKLQPGSIASIPNTHMLLGTFEHRCRELVSKSLRKKYLAFSSSAEVDQIAIHQEIKDIVERTRDDFNGRYPAFSVEINDCAVILMDRLWKEEDQRICKAYQLMKSGVTDMLLLENVLPVSEEYAVESKQLALKGKIDQVWKIGGCLIPLDIKTGTAIPSMFLGKEHQIQLACYALLLESERREDVDLAQVYFTSIFSLVPFIITNELRKETLQTRDRILLMLKSDKEPAPCKNDDCEFCAKNIPLQVVREIS